MFAFPLGGERGLKVKERGDESGDGVGPLHDVNALKYIVPLTNDSIVTGKHSVYK